MRKNFIKAVAMVLLLATVCVAFASCGKTLSGKYSAELLGTGATMTFKGSKITTTYKAAGKEIYTVEGTYKIEDDKITITYEGEKADEAKDYAGTFDFKEKEDGSIKIGIFTLKPVE